MWMMESHIGAMSLRQMTAMNACTGTLTSSWRKELIASPLRTKMDLGLTTSAGQEKINNCIQIAEDIYKRALTHTISMTQKPRRRKDALVFLQTRPQVAVGLL